MERQRSAAVQRTAFVVIEPGGLNHPRETLAGIEIPQLPEA
jgi:hypothetical protein